MGLCNVEGRLMEMGEEVVSRRAHRLTFTCPCAEMFAQKLKQDESHITPAF